MSIEATKMIREASQQRIGTTWSKDGKGVYGRMCGKWQVRKHGQQRWGVYFKAYSGAFFPEAFYQSLGAAMLAADHKAEAV